MLPVLWFVSLSLSVSFKDMPFTPKWFHVADASFLWDLDPLAQEEVKMRVKMRGGGEGGAAGGQGGEEFKGLAKGGIKIW